MLVKDSATGESYIDQINKSIMTAIWQCWFGEMIFHLECVNIYIISCM